ncbi:MAG: hypothetical protein DRP08_04435 [Candidatus Aenigmatarchaeota archaeon]|nr:MAG: hypothetical protein DRP08_04435 [Candidatus Aenigmarchaeota archaeon]
MDRKNALKEVDRLLEILGDAEEHKITELYRRVSLTPETIRTVIEFLHEHGFVKKYLKEDGIYVRITAKGLEFLTLKPNKGDENEGE